MKVTLFGVRGTSPVTEPGFAVYGGETTSVLIEGRGGEKIAIDAGTGMRILGNRLNGSSPDGSLLLLMTHYHLDHVMGLPSFSLLYEKGWKVAVTAPKKGGLAAEEVMPKILDKPFWPLQIENLEAMVAFSTLEGVSSEEPLKVGELEVRWAPLHHPGGSTAYRIDGPSPGESFLFATDVEWGESSPEEKTAFKRLAAEGGPPGLLVFDGQFAVDNYEKYKGWGHSAWEEAVEVARESGARRLLVTHHSPRSDDRRLETVDSGVKERMEGATLARGGMEIEL